MLLGYNTNGFAHHDPLLALELLAEIGYRSVALTIDYGLLNPHLPQLAQQITEIRRALDRYQLRSVIETGARFLLNPREKHEPTLVSPDPADRARRVRFLQQAIDIAAELKSDCVSFWSGVVKDNAAEKDVWQRLRTGLEPVIEYAEQRNVTLGFEPEPGMFIDTMEHFATLTAGIHSPRFQLTLDVGHLHCLGETPLADQIRRWAARIVNVHIEDMRHGVHEHLQFGDGEIDFPPVLAAFRDSGYTGGLHVELSRHSHDAPRAAQHAFAFLSPLLNSPD